MANIIITGANGQLGSEFRDLETAYPQHRFLFCTRAELDINSEESIRALFTSFKPQYCVNCAAYTAVDKAETDWEGAYATNATAVKNLAAACAQSGAQFIHISTDYVFDGNGTAPYTEVMPTDPVNSYGRSKQLGEQEATFSNAHALIIRTSWVYSSYGNNFVKTMLRLMNSRPEVGVVADQQGSPTYAADLAIAIMHIIESGKWQAGIYHYSNEGIITWHHFAQAIKELTGAACNVRAITTPEFPTPAKRPAYSGMDKSKIKNTYGVPVPYWQESLEVCLAKINSIAKV